METFVGQCMQRKGMRTPEEPRDYIWRAGHASKALREGVVTLRSVSI